jgi:hypothetical protein
MRRLMNHELMINVTEFPVRGSWTTRTLNFPLVTYCRVKKCPVYSASSSAGTVLKSEPCQLQVRSDSILATSSTSTGRLLLHRRPRLLLPRRPSDAPPLSPPPATIVIPRWTVRPHRRRRSTREDTSRNVNIYDDLIVTFRLLVKEVISAITNFVTSSQITSDGAKTLK